MKVAIVGGGPRCVFALEALAERADPPEVIVFEPRAELGSGVAYQSDQPDYFRLNVASDAVLTRSILGCSFREWLERRDPDGARDPYPPRAVVGRFLAECAAVAGRRLRGLTHVREAVLDVEPTATGWRVWTGAGATEVDSVLLVAGHDTAWSQRMAPERAVPTYPATYAAGRRPLGTVAIRGAALTAIDATLASTEGRGGAFVPSDRRMGALSYAPGDWDARSIIWVSRSGQLMSPKTDHSPNLRRRLVEVVRPLHPLNESRPTGDLLEEATDRIAVEAGAEVGTTDHQGSQEDSHTWLEHQIQMARGLTRPDRTWARAQAWRVLYPALVERHLDWQRTGGGPAEGWPTFERLARELERLAFGPPLINAEKCLALMDAGTLAITTGEIPQADLTIDAVLAPSGIASSGEPLWNRLRERGVIEVAAGGRGAVAIDIDGTALVDGARMTGLAIIGRATEGVVLGNDTLSRTLHAHLDRWAEQLTHAPEGAR